MKPQVTLKKGDSLEVLKTYADNTFDSLVTDPPAGIGFMGRSWDGEDTFKFQMPLILTECLRVMKPGAWGLVWALPRTSHWTATALEYAGFEIRDVIVHIAGQGFPKSLNVGKAVDEALGNEGVETGEEASCPDKWFDKTDENGRKYHQSDEQDYKIYQYAKPTRGFSSAEGYGTALKPSSEHWILVRKPCSEKTVADNWIKHGVGGINIDGCRIGSEAVTINGKGNDNHFHGDLDPNGTFVGKTNTGRFPANTVFSHTADCVKVGTVTEEVPINVLEEWSGFGQKERPDYKQTVSSSTTKRYACVEGCPVKVLDEQSGIRPAGTFPAKRGATAFFGLGDAENRNAFVGQLNDTGTASRFFYCAKPSKREKNAGLEAFGEKAGAGLPMCSANGTDEGTGLDGTKTDRKTTTKNTHPTVKSIELMTYLIRLVTPTGGTVFDPFMGSGTTGCAAVRGGWHFTGIEREKEYFKIAQARIKFEQKKQPKKRKPAPKENE